MVLVPLVKPYAYTKKEFPKVRTTLLTAPDNKIVLVQEVWTLTVPTPDSRFGILMHTVKAEESKAPARILTAGLTKAPGVFSGPSTSA